MFSYPRILSCSNHLTSQLDKLSASNNSERNVCVHRVVDFLNSFIVSWKVINLNPVCLQLFVDFGLECKFVD